MVNDVITTREKSNLRRGDFLQILIDMRNNTKLDDMDENLFQENKYTLTMDEIVAQCFVFFIAGFDTSSSTMQFCLYELARNEKLQQKARQEVDEMYEKNRGKITYESIMELKYLAQVIDGKPLTRKLLALLIMSFVLNRSLEEVSTSDNLDTQLRKRLSNSRN